MSYLSFLTLLLISIPFAAAAQTALAPFSTFLKENSSIQQIAIDPAGNIYVFGQVTESPTPGNGQDVFVAKLDPAASKFIYFVYFGGSSTETASGLAVDAAGNAYIAGTTMSSDFPTLPQSSMPADSNPQLPVPFAAKLNANGVIVYSTLFSNGTPALTGAIAVDPAGDAVITGRSLASGFPSTPGAFTVAGSTNEQPFVVKLDVTGTKLLFSAIGVGGSSAEGSRLVLDAANNIFLAGNMFFAGSAYTSSYPTTADAFQTTFTPYLVCPGPTCMYALPAPEQYVTKLSADGSKLIYSTFLTGSEGAQNQGLAIDAAGDAWVTGETVSTDYPYTGTQPAGSRPNTFTTELDPTGAKVLLSVQQGGSGIALDPSGNIVLAGSFAQLETLPPYSLEEPNPPPPPTGNTPSPCLPGASTISNAAYAMRLSSRDGSVLGIKILTGTNLSQVSSAVDGQGNIYVAGDTGLPDVPLTPGIPFSSAVAQRTVSGSFLARTDLSSSPLACVADSANGAPIGPVAPGQLITLYGNGLGPAEPAIGLTGAANVPVSLGGVSVAFDGIPAPLLYVSSTQINVQVPFEIYRSASTVMQLSFNGSPIGSRLFAVAQTNPSLFLDSSGDAVALNQDGSLNSFTNPAKGGTDVVVFVNGDNFGNGGLTTGLVVGAVPYPLDEPVAAFGYYQSLLVDSISQQPGAIDGLVQIQVHLPVEPTIPGETAPGSTGLTLIVNGAEVGPFTGAGVQVYGYLWIAPN
jgi:uncharacterized protein (TIGR03437 family)